MSKLRDLLNAQKKEQANGNAKSVLQSEPQKATVKIETAGTVPSQEKSLPDAIVNGQAIEHKTAADTVVEQGPPSGLSFLQRRKWEAEHAKRIANTESNTSGNGGAGAVGTDANKPAANGSAELDAATKAAIENNPALFATPKQEEQTQVAEKSSGNNASDGKIDVETLRANLVYLANNIEQPEMVGQVVKKIAMQLKQTPELVPFMKDADFDLIVRGARSAYKIAARKKAEARDKKVAGKKDQSALMAEFKAAGLDELLGTIKL